MISAIIAEYIGDPSAAEEIESKESNQAEKARLLEPYLTISHL